MNEMDTRFANQYNIQWFPGHMTKTLRMMEQEIQHVDASLVLLDARIPLSSLNPEIERITARKPKLYALNKADLADPAVTEEWIRYFRAADAGCVAISAKQKGGANAVKVAIEKELSGLLERRQNRGMGGAKTQVMLCGIPNVGKSTFINTFAGSARAKAADRPGVTKGKQWVSTEKFDLLDMPGVLWKKFDSKTIASNLAFIGSIKDDILDVEELAMNLLDEVRRNYPELVAQRYKLDAETLALPPYELMEAIGRKRGLLVRGGKVFLCHAGDSRAYLYRDGQLAQLTHDHSYVQELVDCGTITAEEAEHHPQKNIITRALGVDYRLEPEFATAQLHSGDILLLCSDGLTNAVPKEQLEQLLRTGKFYDLPDLLIRTANENGGPDNITALLVGVEPMEVRHG